MPDIQSRTETARLHTDHGVPLSLTVGDRGCEVPHHTTTAGDVAEALAGLGYVPLGRICWVDRTLSVLSVRRREVLS